MKTNIVVDISPPISYLTGKCLFLKLWAKMLSANQIAGFFKTLYLKKKWMMKFIFGMQINLEVFYKLILSFWVC